MLARVGLGWDIHRLEPGTGLRLGGVLIPCGFRVIAHSDGDVLVHALCDALLGALALGDLGEWFPDTDPAHQGQDSCVFWQRICADSRVAAWKLVNLDCNIIAQEPRLGPYKAAIRQSLSTLTGLPPDAIGVKARSHEGVDAIGQCQALAAQVVLLMAGR